MKQAWEKFWHGRTLRERTLIGIGTTVLAIGFAYAYLWLPIAREREQLVREMPRLRADAQQMLTQTHEIERLRGTTKATAADLKALLQQATLNPVLGGATAQVSAEANGRVSVAFATVRAGNWLNWVTALQEKQGIRLASARIEALDGTDSVKVIAVFGAGS